MQRVPVWSHSGVDWRVILPARVQRAGKTRWTRGHAVWASDEFAWRGSPAAWNEALWQVTDIEVGELAGHSAPVTLRTMPPGRN